jgi:zinc protease
LIKLLQKRLQAKKIVKKVFDKETGIYSYKLENNVTVLFKPTTFRQNEVLLSAVSPGGLSALPTEALNDVKKASGWVMQSAPGTLKPDELRTLMADKSARVDFRISRFDEKIDGYSNSKDLETLLKLVYVYATVPKIDPGVDRQLRNSALALARQSDRDPAYKFNKALNTFYYMDNPRILFDTKESIMALNNEKMLKLFKKKFNAMNHFTFILVGDTNPEVVEKLIALYLANLPTASKEEKVNTKPFAYKKGKQTFVKAFNTSNIANTGLKYRSELDYTLHDDLVLSVMQEILNVRLRNLIREDKSGTYGVGIKCGIIRELEKTASCNIRFASDPTRENELVGSIEKSIINFIEEGPTAQELRNIQTEYALMYKKALRDNYFWLSLMNDHAKFNDDMKTRLKFNDEIKKVTTKEVQTMAKKMFSGDLLLSKRIPQKDSGK